MTVTRNELSALEVANLMHRTGRTAVGASMAAALCVSSFVWTSDLNSYVLIWLVAALALGIYRLSVFSQYRRTLAQQTIASTQTWVARFDRSVLFNGLMWGVGGIIIAMTPNIIAQVILALCLCSLFAGAIASYFAHLRAVFLFAVPALTPFSVLMLTDGAQERVVVGGCMLTFFGIASIAALQVRDSLEHRLPGHPAFDSGITPPTNDGREQRRVEHLYKNAVMNATGSLLAAAAVIYLLRENIDIATAGLWFAALSLAVVLRLMKVVEYRRGSIRQPAVGYWLRNFNYPLVVVGLAWSVGAIALPQTELGEMLMMVCIFGLVAGAIAGFSSHMSAVASVAVPSVIPFGIFLTIQRDEVHVVMGVALFIFSTLLVLAGSRIGRLIREGFAHEVENEQLIASLTEHTNTIEELNNELETRVRLRTEELNVLVAELRENSGELTASRKQYRDIVEHTQELIQSVDNTGQLVFANQAWQHTLGYNDGDLMAGLGVLNLVAPEHRDHYSALFAKLLQGDKVDHIEFAMIGKHGQRIELAGSIYSDIRENNSNPTFGIFSNVTAVRAADAALQSSEARFQAIFSRSSVGILIIDPELVIIDANPYAHEILDHLSDTLRGNSLRSIVGPEHRTALERQVREVFNDAEVAVSVELEFTRRGERTIWAELELAAIKDSEGTPRFVAVIVNDVTERKALADVAQHNASHDYLTGLINRREFEHRLEQYLQSAAPESPHALVYFDLDRFKIINDTCGHSTGDILLRRLSDVLSKAVPSDCHLARIGGDEFGLLIPATTAGEADVVTRALISAIENFRFEYENRIHAVGVSAGIVLIRGDESINEALQAADAACYAAKRAGRGRVEFYDKNQADMRLQRDQIRAATTLADAMNDGRLSLYAQPIAAIGKSVVGPVDRYELLLRIEDEHGIISGPQHLLPAAEKYDYATEIDRWVVLHTLQRLTQLDLSAPFPLKLSINLSAQSLISTEFEDFLADQLDTCPFSRNLSFEITENHFMSNFERATTFMRRMHRLGCRFALDDFGTGFSSYGYLKELKVDSVKIDGTFVTNIDHNPIDEAIVQSIVGVARAMRMTTIAEYVERDSQATILRAIGVDMVQGHAIGREIPLDDVLNRLSRSTA